MINGPAGSAPRRRARRLAVAGTAAFVFALSAGVAHAVFGSLTFVEQEKDGVGGVDGLSATKGLTTSPDGAHVYVVGQNDSSIVTFSRDSASGAITFVEREQDGVGGVDGINVGRDVAVSPDGNSVYVTGANDNAVAAFSRDPASGALTFVEMEKDGVGGVDGLSSPADVVVSPDGAHVYVASISDFAVSTFSRNPTTGALTFVEFDRDGVGGVDGLAGANGLAISPDGAHVYVTGSSDNAVATFSRNPATGALSFVEFDQDGVGGVDGLSTAFGVATSPDGAQVYVAGTNDDAVATFSRNPASGALSFVEFDQNGVGGVDGLNGANSVAPSPDGAHVYVTASQDGALAVFSRDPATGALAFVEVDRDGQDGVDGLAGAQNVAVSPDGAHVYATGRNDNAVAAFSREGPPDASAGDADPPETQIVKGPKKKTKKRKAKFEFSSDEPGSTFQCKLDKGGFEPCDPAERFKVKRRRHELEVRAIDPAGNVDPTPAQQKWKVRRKK